MLSVSIDELVEGVQLVLDQSRQKDWRIGAINQRYYEMKAETLKDFDGVLTDIEEGMNNVELRKCCDHFMKHTDSKVVGVFGRKDDSIDVQDDNCQWNYVIGSATVDVRSKSKDFNALTNGRGGGQKEMIQGSAACSETTLRKAMEKVFSC